MIIYTMLSSHENIQEVILNLHRKENLASTYQKNYVNSILNIEQCAHQWSFMCAL